MADVLVTGEAGYIGSHGCKALKAAGSTPETMDALRNSWPNMANFAPFTQSGLPGHAAILQGVALAKAVAVTHFTVLKLVGKVTSESRANPDRLKSQTMIAEVSRQHKSRYGYH